MLFGRIVLLVILKFLGGVWFWIGFFMRLLVFCCWVCGIVVMLIIGSCLCLLRSSGFVVFFGLRCLGVCVMVWFLFRCRKRWRLLMLKCLSLFFFGVVSGVFCLSFIVIVCCLFLWVVWFLWFLWLCFFFWWLCVWMLLIFFWCEVWFVVCSICCVLCLVWCVGVFWCSRLLRCLYFFLLVGCLVFWWCFLECVCWWLFLLSYCWLWLSLMLIGWFLFLVWFCFFW